MTQDDIIRMAQECQLIGMRPYLDGIYEEALQEFAKAAYAAGVKAEREACAKVFDEMAEDMEREMEPSTAIAYVCSKAAAIRARGQK